jgi:hypothetical protein
VDLAVLRTELRHAEDTAALMKLQQLLTTPDTAALILQDVGCRSIDHVRQSLNRLVFKANLVQMINVTEQSVSEDK